MDIVKYAQNKIPYFRGVFMRDKLPRKARTIECGIVNLDSSKHDGTHWVAYAKLNEYCEYFDSFGDLKPPLELIKYFGNRKIFYNYSKYQNFGTTNCGHLCIKYLINFWLNHLDRVHH